MTEKEPDKNDVNWDAIKRTSQGPMSIGSDITVIDVEAAKAVLALKQRLDELEKRQNIIGWAVKKVADPYGNKEALWKRIEKWEDNGPKVKPPENEECTCEDYWSPEHGMSVEVDPNCKSPIHRKPESEITTPFTSDGNQPKSDKLCDCGSKMELDSIADGEEWVCPSCHAIKIPETPPPIDVDAAVDEGIVMTKQPKPGDLAVKVKYCSYCGEAMEDHDHICEAGSVLPGDLVWWKDGAAATLDPDDALDHVKRLVKPTEVVQLRIVMDEMSKALTKLIAKKYHAAGCLLQDALGQIGDKVQIEREDGG